MLCDYWYLIYIYAQPYFNCCSIFKKSQVDADHAWKKIQATGDLQQGLEAECEELRWQFAESKKQNASLIAACSLLSGALYPLCDRANQLSNQRRFFEDYINIWEPCRKQASILVETLSTEMISVTAAKSDKPKLCNKKLLLRFRVGVVCVLAANRLKTFGQYANTTVICDTHILDHGSLLICTGGLSKITGN